MLGQILGGRYRLVQVLGAGGFGQTYIAQDTHRPGQPACVVKHLKPASDQPSFLQTARRLFVAEAEILEKLGGHGQIPRLLAYFEENREFYLVEEFIAGWDLGKVLLPGRCLSEAEVLVLLWDTLQVLEFVHRCQVIHRDIKPSNLIRRKQDGKIVLIDFGAVKQVSTQANPSAGETSLTIAIGSPSYMPSEQLGGQPRPCSDLYALGLVGIQALTGLPPRQLPKDAVSHEFLWRDHASVNPKLADLLDKLVRYDFRERYQTAAEGLQALRLIASQLAAAPPPSPSSPAQPTRPAAAAQPLPQLLGVGALLVAVLLAGGYYRQRTAQPTRLTDEATPSAAVQAAALDPVQWAQRITLAQTLPGQKAVRVLAVSPDGQMLASGSDDNLVKLWDPKTGNRLRTLPGHAGAIQALAISSDGQTLVSGSDDQTIKVWKLGTGKLLRSLSGHRDAVAALAISPDGQTLVSGSADRTIRVWRLSTGQLLHTLTGSTNSVSSLVIAPDGQTLVSCSGEATVRLWNLQTGALSRTLTSPYPVESVGISPDGQTLVSGSPDGIRLWNLGSGDLLRRLPQTSASLASMAISANGQLLLSGIDFRQSVIKLWDARTGELLRLLEGHTYTVASVAFSPDGQAFYSGSIDGTVKIWRLR